uniref:TNF receptor-associated factor n=1 Tax=Gouania willdenowi TaxID=441366 RepID=A0A8C5DD57_GOUWI
MARISLECSSSLPGIPLSVLSVPMENKYKCQQCLQVLRKPVQAQCGHRFCVHCFKQLTSSGPKPCEACRLEEIYEEPISILNSNEAFSDNAAGREIASLPARCVNHGCSWTGSMKEYEAQHESCCEFERVRCEACQSFILRTEKERHYERECEERTLNCKYCKVTFTFKDIKAHDEICQKFPLQCKNCGKKKIAREKMNDHNKSCAKSKSACPYSEVGCKYVVRMVNSTRQVNKCTPLSQHLCLSTHVQHRTTCPHSHMINCWMDTLFVTALENIVCVLNREVERSSVTIEAFSHQHRLDQDKIENLSNKVRQLERTLAMRDLQLSETEQVVRELQFCTFDGVFVWKISDFARRRQDAVGGRAPAMFSPAFYSSKYGYKMCLRLYLNGDGTGRGTHLSLFFVVMRGKCDALLKWPFGQKVTLMLLDQNNREHIIDAFRPDVTSTSFQRPISEMNIASGCPLFCPLAKLAGKSPYLRDDTIFIKAIVDLTGL